MMFKELTRPQQQDPTVQPPRWWVEQVDDSDMNLSIHGGFLSTMPTDLDDFMFDSESDAHKVAYEYYTNNGEHYPYISEWICCLPKNTYPAFIDDDVDDETGSQIMRFE